MKVAVRWVSEGIQRDVDSQAGARIYQLTSNAVTSHDYYCEERYTSTDGTRVAVARCPFGRPTELWVGDLTRMRVARLDQGSHLMSNFYRDDVFYVRGAGKPGARLMRVDLKTFEQEEVAVLDECPVPISGSVSPDGRWYASGMRVGGDIYGLFHVDLGSGAWETFHQHKDILNPHVQFEPSKGEDILVQLNRGGIQDEDGNIVLLVGEEGATLYVIGSDGGNYRPLPVGKPYTAPVTGHECWVGRTGRVLLTTCDDPADGTLYIVTPGEEKAEVLNKGLQLCHISASTDGRFYVGDEGHTGLLHVGSIETGKVRPFCQTHTSFGTPQAGHPHAYMTPGNEWVIYNSDCTGIAQVYAARMPQGFLESLL